MNTPYTPPSEVTSPRKSWALIAVLDEGSESQTALAVGLWDQKPVLAMRWNGNAKNPIGHPQSRGLPTWFAVCQSTQFAALRSFSCLTFLPCTDAAHSSRCAS